MSFWSTRWLIELGSRHLHKTHCQRSRPKRWTTNWLKGYQPSRFRHFLPHCLAARLTDLETETLGETVAEKYAEVLYKLAYGLRKVDVEAVNETLADGG